MAVRSVVTKAGAMVALSVVLKVDYWAVSLAVSMAASWVVKKGGW